MISNKKYKVIYADPPWEYSDKAKGFGGAESHYRTMAIEDLILLPVEEIAERDSILFLWATFPKLNEALDLIDGWGFNYKTLGFNWVKTNKKKPATLFWGLGHYTRSNPEICLIATKGKGVRPINKGIHSVLLAPLEGHSKKPDITRDKIVKLVGPISRIELFARKKVEGWDSWGDQI